MVSKLFGTDEFLRAHCKTNISRKRCMHDNKIKCERDKDVKCLHCGAELCGYHMSRHLQKITCVNIDVFCTILAVLQCQDVSMGFHIEYSSFLVVESGVLCISSQHERRPCQNLVALAYFSFD